MKLAYEWDPWGPTPTLDEHSLAEVRRLIDVPLRRKLHNTIASRIAIVRFARGIGDRNPLCLEEEYGRGTKWGCMMAPPTFPYSIDNTIVAPGLRGIHTLCAGTDWEFFKPIRLGDSFTVEARLIDALEKTGSFCGRMILQIGEVIYRNTWDEIVAKVTSEVMRVPRGEAKKMGKYLGIRKHSYSVPGQQSIEDAYDAEEIRGAAPRYWEDVIIGDELTPVVKGPLSAEDLLSFVAVNSPVIALGRSWRHFQRHPADFYINPQTGLLDSPAACLIDDVMAQECGFPAAHDTGIERVTWLGNLMTNWIGDDAFLKKLSIKIHLPCIYGDTTWCKGKVINKYVKGDEHLVECDIWCEKQTGETTALGHSLVALPSSSIRSGQWR